jgi:small subunit ribosomal protein S15
MFFVMSQISQLPIFLKSQKMLVFLYVPGGCIFKKSVLLYRDRHLNTMLTARKKTKAIKDAQIHVKDTGSPEVQISLLSKKITELTNHLKVHKKDNHSRRGLIHMVASRRTHLKYLETTNKKRYSTIVSKLGLK